MMRERAPRSTLVPTPGVVADLLSWRARHQAERTAYVFLLDGETDAVVLTYGELDLQARRVAAELRRSAAAGKPVILCYPPGLEYIPAFLGCFYAGAVAVPAYAPEARRLQRTLPRLAAICENVGAEIALTSPACYEEVASLFRRRPELGNVSVRAVDTTAGDVLDHGREAATTPDEIAFLMYTSGSTGSPKGAMISHASVLHNLSTFPGFHSRPPRGFVCWLPFFHDLGLMMGILHPLYRGVPGILMAPLTFAQRPLRWIEAISRYRATTTGGPNFAYGLCVAKSDARERQRLDLSSWNLALNGSEPVRQQTLERFTAAFTASGFRRESFYPSYGLAEATATVTGACTLEPPVYAFVHRSDAERGRATPTSSRESERVMPLVGCGPGIVDQEIAIVDPLTRSRCAPTEIGEIWVRGPSIAQGYWRRPAETEELLRARLADTGEGPFLRTGDLGFLDDGELYLSGRLKDLIIVHGANHHPEDVELTLAAAHPAVRPGCGAVFAVEEENEERVVVVQEVRLSEDLERREVVSRIRAGVAEEHGLELHAVVLVRPGTIPKTSSGKLRRSACRKEYREGSLAVVGEWQGGAVTVAPGAPSDEPPTGTAIESWLVTYLARELCLPPTAIDVRQPFARFGLPSIGAVAMVAEIESWLGRRLPPTLAWDHPSIEALARHLGEEPSAAVITSEPEAAGDEPIAIVGMSCRLPGAPHLEAYWQLLRNGIDAVTEIPPERWDVDAFYDPDPAAPGKMVTRWGGFLADLDRFDAAFFGLSPREAIHLDPQQRVLMELAWEALEDAGIPPFSLAGSRAGVFIATLSNDYGTNLFTRHAAGVEAYSGTGNADTMASSRVSYFLDLRGPSLTVDTACSGSLVALKLACESLSSGTSTLAFAGGVNAILRPDANLFFSKAGALAPDGRCKPFDARANGIVRSEGAGIVLLQPLSRALADGRRIDALILGGAINHDGRSNGVMAPNGQAQEELLREAYRRAGVTPGQVQYVEAHGTGTHLGDPVEAKALGAVLGAERAPGSYCALGSVKSNLGHTEAAAGICGVIKTALALKHRQIPATVHFATPNPLIPFADLPLRVQRELGPWPAPEQTLVAGVSCFGIGGTNAHVVLQEAPHSPPALSADGAQEEVQILALSAHDPAALGQLAASFRELSAGDQGTPSLAAAAYTAAVHRSHLRHRLALTATSRREAAGKLAAFTAGEASSGLVAGSEPVGRRPQLVMVFSGQGSHWCRMGRRLFAREQRFAEIIRRCDELLRDLAGWSLVDELSAPEPSCRFAETAVAQPAIFAVQVALAALWRSWGIVPHTVIGQSLGEIAAAHVAGALSLAEALRVVFHRSRLMQRVAGQGATALVGLSADNTSLALAGFAGELSIAGSSSPETTVVSGDPEALRRLIASLESRDVFARVLRDVDVAFHSPQMDSLTGELTAALAGLEAGPAGCRFLSTVTGDELRGEELTAAYWARNLRQPFRFYEATAKLAELGHDAFLEIGPHPVLSGSVRQTIRALDREAVVLPSLRRGEDEAATLLGSLAELYANGHRVDWKGVFPRSRRPVALPSYPWQRRRFWLDQLLRGEPEGESAPGQRRDAAGHPLLGAHVAAARPLGQHVWERDLSARSLHWLDEHRVHGTVVLPASAQLEMARRSAKEALGDVEPELAEVTFAAPLVLAPNGDARRIQLVFEPREKAAARFLIFSRELGNGTGDKPWILHSSGRVRPGPGETPEPPAVDLDELRQLFSEAVAQQDHYRTLRLLGLDYGPSFQAVAELWRRDGEALARLELPPGPRSEVGAYGIHPALLDAALQTVSAAFGGGPEEEISRGTFVPVGLEGFRVYRPPGPDAWCRVRMRPAAAGTADQQADVAIFDDDGRLVAEVASLRLRRLDARRAEGPLYGLRWQRSADGARPADPAAEQGWWLLLADATGEAEQLEAAFRARGEECILVRPGDAFRVAEQGRRIRLDPRRPEHFRQLLEQAPASAPAPQCRGIIHLWNLDAAGSEELTVKALEESRTLGTESVLRMLQALTQADWERVAQMAVAGSWQQLPPLWVITRGAQAVTAGERVAVAQAPVWGLGRVIVREHPELWAGLIDLDPQARGAAATDRLLAELDLTRSEAGVALRDGERYTLSLEPVGGAGGVHLRADASYLITGGFGGLGLAVARWLAEQGARRLFLVGRTPLPARESWCELEAGTPAAERAAAVRSLEALGVSVHPVALDVADEVQVDSFFDRFRRAGWPPIRGVVHAAGVVRDQLLARLSTEAFAEAWRPKVLGAWLLHDKLRDEELDFFVLFSSIASVLGSFGQGNYAAGNAFLDALAHQRRAAGLPATSINWGPWAEVGMAARQGLEAFHRQGGIEAFSTAEGLESLGRAMASTEAQLLALRADWKLWARSAGTAVATLVAGLVEEDGQGAPAAPIGAPGALAEEILAMADPAARRERLGERLLELCGTVLRLDPSLIDPRQPLPTLGIDSIMTMEIRGQIEASFGVEVPMTEMLMGMSLNRVADLVLAGLTEESGAARGGQARTAGVTVESGA